MNHLLSIEDLDRDAIERILDRAKSFTEVSEPARSRRSRRYAGRRVLNLFYEASTRTRSAFTSPPRRSAPPSSTSPAAARASEGRDAHRHRVDARGHRRDAIVIRTPHVGAAAMIARGPTPRHQRRRRQSRAPHPGAARRQDPPRAARPARRAHRRDRRRRHPLAGGALERPGLHQARPGGSSAAAHPDPARLRVARLRGRVHAGPPPGGRRRLRAADAEGAHDRLLRPVPARVRRRLPDRRPPARTRRGRC